MCHHLAMGVVLCEVFQLHIENGSLNLVKTAIATGIFEDILLLTAIVCQGTYSSCKLGIVGSNSTTITKSSEVLARVE